MTKDATVKFYQSPDAASSSQTLPANATLNVLDTVTQNNKTWYKVQYNGQTGYVEAEAALTEVTAGASPTPTSTFVIGTMIPINYEDETVETQTSGVPWGLIGGAVVVIGGAGGAYAYAPQPEQEAQGCRRAGGCQQARRHHGRDDRRRSGRSHQPLCPPRSCRTHRAGNQAERHQFAE